MDENESFHGRERRQFPRVQASIVEYFPIGQSTIKEATFTVNISAGGICFFTHEELKKDLLLLLKFYLSYDAGPIVAEGKVVWSSASTFLAGGSNGKSYDIGIEFTEIDESDRQSIYEYAWRCYYNKPFFFGL